MVRAVAALLLGEPHLVGRGAAEAVLGEQAQQHQIGGLERRHGYIVRVHVVGDDVAADDGAQFLDGDAELLSRFGFIELRFENR